ncbi:hypothetical protein GCM10009662_79750 [Catellatospora coxensis]|uniref:Uncharacterized protein n=1 Tax=Catellatospora coxensis TaxID=310354 RepID=A0A8J3PBM6_9ACTN|nr:hypothetical protein Cco03nite_82210 [Catellatospora coxensis]
MRRFPATNADREADLSEPGFPVLGPAQDQWAPDRQGNMSSRELVILRDLLQPSSPQLRRGRAKGVTRVFAHNGPITLTFHGEPVKVPFSSDLRP